MYNFNEKKLFRYTRSIHRIERKRKHKKEKIVKLIKNI